MPREENYDYSVYLSRYGRYIRSGELGSRNIRNTLRADVAELLPGSRRTDGLTVEWEGMDMPTVYKAFQALVILANSV